VVGFDQISDQRAKRRREQLGRVLLAAANVAFPRSARDSPNLASSPFQETA
jgi:hypothetical protein